MADAMNESATLSRPEQPPRHVSATRPVAFSRPRILLAEDDADLRQMIAEALRSDGHDVVEAKNGGRLLVCIGTAYLGDRPLDAFDLLISDVRMPVCSGLQVLEGLRQAHWRTPSILMTAFGSDALRERARALGAAYFDKPFDLDDLRTAVVHMLQHKRLPGA
jgi:CheY-like chemotaxis protein